MAVVGEMVLSLKALLEIKESLETNCCCCFFALALEALDVAVADLALAGLALFGCLLGLSTEEAAAAAREEGLGFAVDAGAWSKSGEAAFLKQEPEPELGEGLGKRGRKHGLMGTYFGLGAGALDREAFETDARVFATVLTVLVLVVVVVLAAEETGLTAQLGLSATKEKLLFCAKLDFAEAVAAPETAPAATPAS